MLVFGATGDTGKEVVEQLLARHYAVTAMREIQGPADIVMIHPDGKTTCSAFAEFSCSHDKPFRNEKTKCFVLDCQDIH